MGGAIFSQRKKKTTLSAKAVRVGIIISLNRKNRRIKSLLVMTSFAIFLNIICIIILLFQNAHEDNISEVYESIVQGSLEGEAREVGNDENIEIMPEHLLEKLYEEIEDDFVHRIPYEEAPLDDLVILPQFVEYYEQNSDFVGWIRIPGLSVDYPIYQEPIDHPDFYLWNDREGNPSRSGEIYIWNIEGTTFRDSQNIFLYGHNGTVVHIPGVWETGMKFTPIARYTETDFFESYNVIELYDRYERMIFVVVMVYRIEIEWLGDGTANHHYLAPYGFIRTGNLMDFQMERIWSSEERFYQYVRLSREHAIQDSGIELRYGDRLINLLTCVNTEITPYRYVVVAIQIE